MTQRVPCVMASTSRRPWAYLHEGSSMLSGGWTAGSKHESIPRDVVATEYEAAVSIMLVYSESVCHCKSGKSTLRRWHRLARVGPARGWLLAGVVPLSMVANGGDQAGSRGRPSVLTGWCCRGAVSEAQQRVRSALSAVGGLDSG